MADEKSGAAPAVAQTPIDNPQSSTTSIQQQQHAKAPSTALSEDAVHLDEKEADRLGRLRPAVFSSTLIEVGFCATILLSMIMAEFLISGFNVLLPKMMQDLNFLPSQKTWPSSVFSLVAGAFLLPFGRLADHWNAYYVFVAGNAWMGIWSIVAGFSKSYEMLVVARALQGLGAAAFLPSGVSLLGGAYSRPGRRKNLVFSIYGGCSPFGFFVGILIAGVAGQLLNWAWFFWIGAIMLSIVCVLAVLSVPAEARGTPVPGDDPPPPMDWLGCATSIPGLMLVVYAITDSPHVQNGWRSPQILVTFLLGVLFLAAFVYIEGWVAKDPLLPPNLFAVKHITALFIVMFMSFGAFGIYLLYASFYIETILAIPPLLAAAWFAPLAGGGLIIALVGGAVLHKIPGTLLIILSTLGFLGSSLIFVFIPTSGANYWAWIFPAMVCATIGIDILYNVSNIFITTSVRSDQQGLAGACLNALVFLGMSFFLGWAELAAANHANAKVEDSALRVAFLLGVGAAGASLLLAAVGIRIEPARGDLTADEKEKLKEQKGGAGNGSESVVV